MLLHVFPFLATEIMMMMMIHPSLHEPLVVTSPAPHHDQPPTADSLSFILSDRTRKCQSDRVTDRTLKIAKLPLLQLIAVMYERANWPLLTVYVRTRRDKSHKAGSRVQPICSASPPATSRALGALALFGNWTLPASLVSQTKDRWTKSSVEQ